MIISMIVVASVPVLYENMTLDRFEEESVQTPSAQEDQNHVQTDKRI